MINLILSWLHFQMTTSCSCQRHWFKEYMYNLMVSRLMNSCMCFQSWKCAQEFGLKEQLNCLSPVWIPVCAFRVWKGFFLYLPAIDRYRENTYEIFKSKNTKAGEHIPGSIKFNNVYDRYRLEVIWVNTFFWSKIAGENIPLSSR
jgi:hypothetical protein